MPGWHFLLPRVLSPYVLQARDDQFRRKSRDVYAVPCRRVSRCERSDSVQGVHCWLLLRSWLVQPAAVPGRQTHGHVTGSHDERGAVHYLRCWLVLLSGRGCRDAMRAWYVWRERRLIDVYAVPCRRSDGLEICSAVG